MKVNVSENKAGGRDRFEGADVSEAHELKLLLFLFEDVKLLFFTSFLPE